VASGPGFLAAAPSSRQRCCRRRCAGPRPLDRDRLHCAISSCSIDDATSNAVGSLTSASRALVGARTSNKEFKRRACVGAVKRRDANETADRMVGAL
jgi:hypothetical protein